MLTEIDFDRLRLQDEIQLTDDATNARTAKRVFTNHDLSVDALLASACFAAALSRRGD